MSKLETNQVDPATGTTLTLGTSGDTIAIPSGVTIDIASGATLDTTGATVTGLNNGLTKLSSVDTTSGTAAVVFNSSVVTAYDNYLIVLNGIKTASAAANGGVMFSTDNGSSFIGRTRFTASVMDLNAGSVGGAHTGTFSLNSVTNPTMWDNHNTEPLCGYFYFQNCNPLNDNTYSVHCNYIDSYTNQGGTEYQQNGSVMYDVTAGQQINYFKVVNATQNIDEGRVILYGFNQ